ncbi:Unknown protein [Striga hermonthica]|uniref:DUF4283 domain-containing protein n=1 Tax=Striga hermonthica TaxID=68872 RepID=A0A9N7MRI0_STRHE|nr:Unknown protein [Striga hermonthica]
MNRRIQTWSSFPLMYWSNTALSRIASTIGVPKVTDGLTAQRKRISFALVEAKVFDKLPDSVELQNPINGVIFKQPIEYEWRTKAKQEWRTKDDPPQKTSMEDKIDTRAAETDRLWSSRKEEKAKVYFPYPTLTLGPILGNKGLWRRGFTREVSLFSSQSPYFSLSGLEHKYERFRFSRKALESNELTDRRI